MIPINTHKASFKKLEPDNSNADKEGYVDIPNLTGVNCNVQPSTANPAEMATGVFSKSHILYLSATYSGVMEGYKVVISGMYDGFLNNTLKVEGVEDWTKGFLPHYEINLLEFQR